MAQLEHINKATYAIVPLTTSAKDLEGSIAQPVFSGCIPAFAACILAIVHGGGGEVDGVGYTGEMDEEDDSELELVDDPDADEVLETDDDAEEVLVTDDVDV